MAVRPRNQRAVFWNIKGPRKTTLKRCPAELKVLAIISTKRQIYRPAQIESICRQQIKLGRKVEIFIRKGKKHYGKRRKCWLPVFSSFPTVFSKGFLPRVLKSRDCVAKILTSIFIRIHSIRGQKCVKEQRRVQSKIRLYVCAGLSCLTLTTKN